jgi:hypothetical protein
LRALLYCPPVKEISSIAAPFVRFSIMSQKNVINLRAVRKTKLRVQKRKQGNENAAKFGRTKSEAQTEHALTTLDIKRLDAHKLDP